MSNEPYIDSILSASCTLTPFLRFDDILDLGQNYLQTANENKPCSGLIRIR